MALRFNRKVFFDLYRKEWGGLDLSQVKGLEALLVGIENDPDVTDVRWAAYMLATVKHECANQFRPIAEFGKGKGRKYGKAVEVTVGGKKYKNVYYGRGYVQLTWDFNYRNVGKGIGQGQKLLADPELALDPKIAYEVMSYGMRNGTFTGKDLDDYINERDCDYKRARKIINGLDKADLIAGHATKFEKILTAAAEAEPAQVDTEPTEKQTDNDTPEQEVSTAQPGSQPPASENSANGSASPFQPETIKQALPQIKNARHWLGGGAGIGFIGMITSKLAGLPDWMVLMIGVLIGMCLMGLIVLMIQHRHDLGKIFKFVAEINADPNTNVIEPVKQ